MREGEKQGFQLSFNRFLRVGFQGSRVTSNEGLLLVRELDERLGFGELIEQNLTDPRANHARFSFADPLRQSVYSRLAGYEDVNDAERLSGPGVAADRVAEDLGSRSGGFTISGTLPSSGSKKASRQ
jgi:hypothetical protein